MVVVFLWQNQRIGHQLRPWRGWEWAEHPWVTVLTGLWAGKGLNWEPHPVELPSRFPRHNSVERRNVNP